MGTNRYSNKVGIGSRQSGFGVMNAIVVISIFASFSIFGLSAVPIYTDHLTIVKIAEDLALSEDVKGKSPRTIKSSINKLFHLNNLRQLNPEDVIQVQKIPGKGLALVIEYEARRPLVYNMDLVAHFKEEPIGLN